MIPDDLRRAALGPLLERDAVRKAALTRALPDDLPVDATAELAAPPGIPGRPERPRLVAHTQLGHGSLRTPEGRAALIHALAHIELNAIENVIGS